MTWVLIIWLSNAHQNLHGFANSQGAITVAEEFSEVGCQKALMAIRAESKNTIAGVCVKK